MILCLTLNPAIDRTLYVNEIKLGEVHRAEKVLVAAGGKGLNVARTIHTLGGNPFCMGPVGGHTGRLLADMAVREGLSAQWTQVRNETRTCTILVQANKDATLINEAGQEIDSAECDALIEDVCRQAHHANSICVCGSLIPGFSQEQFRYLLSELCSLGKRVWVDTSGEALKTVLDVRGICIKVNAAELGDALETKISDMEDTPKVMSRLRARGISQIAVTFGKQGAVLCTEMGLWVGQPPKIELVSSVGSGDAFLGGLLFALERNASPEISLRNAIAAGAANAREFGGGKFSYRDFSGSYKKMKISVSTKPDLPEVRIKKPRSSGL